MVDGYQECLHCQYTHPSFSVYYPPTFYTVYNHENFSQHVADPKKSDDGLFLYFFPICTLNVYGGGMSSFRVCPTGEPGITRMEFDYYHVEEGAKFEDYYQFTRQVAMEDFELCEKAQTNLEKGVYSEGILNPEKESGVACESNLAILEIWLFNLSLCSYGVLQITKKRFSNSSDNNSRKREISATPRAIDQ